MRISYQAKWRESVLTERTMARLHDRDLCRQQGRSSLRKAGRPELVLPRIAFQR